MRFSRLSLFLLLVLCLGAACSGGKRLTRLREAHPVRRFFPPEVQNLYFGMPINEFLGVRKNLSRVAEQDAFRDILVEEYQGEQAEQGVYYFDTDGDMPLYEIILEYPTEKDRDRVASEYLGAPNYQDAEWRHESGEGYTIWAWTFKKKLIIAAILPDTEWADEK